MRRFQARQGTRVGSRTKQAWCCVFGPVNVTQRQGFDSLQSEVVLGYIDLVQYFSAVFGRNLEQSSVWRVSGVDVVGLTPSTEFDVGFAANGFISYIPPTRQRVAAHKWYAQRWLTQARAAYSTATQTEPARGRQFYVKYDTAMTSVAYHSTLEDDSSSTDIEPSLIGTSAAGTAVAIFDEFNSNYPGYPAASDGEDQRLYTRKAAEQEEHIPWYWVYSSEDTAGRDSAGVAPYLDSSNIVMSSWRAPAGHACEWMTGQARVFLKATTVARSTTQDPDVITFALCVWVEGWRPLR